MSNQLGDIIGAAAQRYGVDPQTLTRIAQIESRMNPRAQNPRSSAGGLFQFIDGTARQYQLGDRFDPAQASDAAARLARDNAAFLSQRLGRAPTPAELYLAHQQGAGGAARILAQPDAPAAQIVGERAITLNGGRPGMTAGQFAQLWTGKFDGATPGVGGRPVQTTSVAPDQAPTGQIAGNPAVFADLIQQQTVGNALAGFQDRIRQRDQDEQARRRALFGGTAALYG